MGKGINIHIYPSDLTAESRMMKITAALATLGYFSKILLIGIQSPKTTPVEVIDADREMRRYARPMPFGNESTPAKCIATLRWYLSIWQALKGENITCINCHSLPVLPLCYLLKLRHKAVLIYDTHELETETSESHGLRRLLAKICEPLFIPRIDYIFCVGHTIAEWYQTRYYIEKPFVIRNISDSTPWVPGAKSPLREKLGLADEDIVVLYLGKLSINRGIERLLRLFSQLSKPVHLAFMGDGPLTSLIQEYGRRYPTIHWHPPVPSKEVVSHARGADIGVSVIDHSCLSYTYAMPNKFFEYLQGGIPVLIGDMPEQREIIAMNQAGWVLPTNDDTAIQFIDSLTPEDVAEKKRNAAGISHLYSWDNERELLKAAYTQMQVQHPDKF